MSQGEAGQEEPAQAKTMTRVGMIALGCAKNRVDGEIMLGHLRRAGCVITPHLAEAEVVIVNTCGFIVDAKQESIDAILEVAELKQAGALQRLVVAGCMSQVFARELAQEIPEIDCFVGLDELESIVAAVRGKTTAHIPEQGRAQRLYDHEQPRLLSTGTYAYLKIAEGCNNPCTFCTIPAMRGSFRSRPIADLVSEARQLEQLGAQEIVLIAQDTTRYGEDLGMSRRGLCRLVQALLESIAVPWIRFLYAYPQTLDDSVLELMAGHERFLSYLDIPLQHVSRTVLQAMRRGGSSGPSSAAALIDRARRLVPDLVLRTTFLVGFPGEGEHEFRELEEFTRATAFDHLGVFSYSWQEECPGAALGDPISEQVKEERRTRLLELQQPISLAKNRQLVGDTLPALVSGPLAEMELLTEARLERQAPEIDGRLLLNDGSAAAGTLIAAEITEAHPYDLVGRVVRLLRPPTLSPPARSDLVTLTSATGGGVADTP